MTKRRDAGAATPGDSSGEPAVVRHSKEQILTSKRFTLQKKDFLRALLKDGKSYTVAEAEQLLDKFLAQEAK